MSNLLVGTVQQAPGTWDKVKATVNSAVHWMGRQILWLKEKIVGLALSIKNWAKPHFDSFTKFASQTATKVKQFVIENKTAVGIGAVAVIAAVVIAILGYSMCCGDDKKGEAKA